MCFSFVFTAIASKILKFCFLFDWLLSLLFRHLHPTAASSLIGVLLLFISRALSFAPTIPSTCSINYSTSWTSYHFALSISFSILPLTSTFFSFPFLNPPLLRLHLLIFLSLSEWNWYLSLYMFEVCPSSSCICIRWLFRRESSSFYLSHLNLVHHNDVRHKNIFHFSIERINANKCSPQPWEH